MGDRTTAQQAKDKAKKASERMSSEARMKTKGSNPRPKLEAPAATPDDGTGLPPAADEFGLDKLGDAISKMETLAHTPPAPEPPKQETTPVDGPTITEKDRAFAKVAARALIERNWPRPRSGDQMLRFVTFDDKIPFAGEHRGKAETFSHYIADFGGKKPKEHSGDPWVKSPFLRMWLHGPTIYIDWNKPGEERVVTGVPFTRAKWWRIDTEDDPSNYVPTVDLEAMNAFADAKKNIGRTVDMSKDGS